jgi:hypothetical protein
MERFGKPEEMIISQCIGGEGYYCEAGLESNNQPSVILCNKKWIVTGI